ncbi:MAG: hypothetical protein ROZ37_15735 [Aromatoleum sp.]|jgi:hypothetical protein|uniref:hypothetical protein n=1 Tax=Aromatoleum sp. TaxID=2307007 RepID=UPI002895BF70|nr:hypothetical protein [Aromatoleum sp.]MDT3671767.1 hypothetical protein [Aromatoleum sp.]
MDAPDPRVPLAGDLALSAQLDRITAEARGHHRLLFLEYLPDDAFALWARAKAITEPDDVAYIHLLASGRGVVSGVIVGLEVGGDDLDDDLSTVLFGRPLVLVAGLDKARQHLGGRLFQWLAWAAATLPLMVASTADATPFVRHLGRHPVDVDQILNGQCSGTAAELAGRAIKSSRENP